MPIVINGHELTDAEIEAELPAHAEASHPMKAATTAVALRRILLDEAQRLGLKQADDEASLTALLDHQVPLLDADLATCRRWYDSNPALCRSGELIEADHILFQVTPSVPLDTLRALAAHTLGELQAGLETDPGLFAQRARELSNCPSGATGGSLGQLRRGDTVPEFEQAVFALPAGTLLPRVLETRFGLHLVRVTHRVEGELLPFEALHTRIREALQAHQRDLAWRQFVQVLVGRADVQGLDLAGSETPLVQ